MALTITSNVSERELFIVEGESAASTVRQAMHKPTQAVLAIKGKLLNVSKASDSKINTNAEIQNIIMVLECGAESRCKVEHLAFTRVIILTDPDADGAHARALLVNFFAKMLSPLIAAGKIFVVTPPLYRLGDVGQAKTKYSWQEISTQVRRHQSPLLSITRFKGIAQFTLLECVELLLDPRCKNRVRLCLDTPNNTGED